jgi:hypothetical protein
MTAFKVKLFVFLHSNTNIRRLAENPEGARPSGLFRRVALITLTQEVENEGILSVICTVSFFWLY